VVVVRLVQFATAVPPRSTVYETAPEPGGVIPVQLIAAVPAPGVTEGAGGAERVVTLAVAVPVPATEK
jgi:hypothetical protein